MKGGRKGGFPSSLFAAMWEMVGCLAGERFNIFPPSGRRRPYLGSHRQIRRKGEKISASLFRGGKANVVR